MPKQLRTPRIPRERIANPNARPRIKNPTPRQKFRGAADLIDVGDGTIAKKVRRNRINRNKGVWNEGGVRYQELGGQGDGNLDTNPNFPGLTDGGLTTSSGQNPTNTNVNNSGPGSGPGSGSNPNQYSTSFLPGGENSNFLTNIYNQATANQDQFNTAANRLRERLDATTQAGVESAQNRNLALGRGNSGLTDRDVFRVQSAGQNAYAQGLNDLSNQFEERRLQGLGIGLGAANSIQGNANFLDKINNELLQSREGNQNQLNIESMRSELAKYLQNDQQRANKSLSDQQADLQKYLQDMMNRFKLYQDSQNSGF